MEENRRYTDECDHAVELARESVFCAEAEELAREFTVKLADLRRTSHLLRFMAARQVRVRQKEDNQYSNAPVYWGHQQTRQISMKGFVIGACQENIMGDSDLHGNIKVRDTISKAVSAYWAALRTDPEATLSEERKNGLFPTPAKSTDDVSLEHAE